MDTWVYPEAAEWRSVGRITVNAQNQADPRIPIFFLSYARGGPAGHHANRSVREFFDDLSENVAQLLPLRPGHSPGFMDTSTMKAGSVWGEEVLTAAARCHVFVPLLTSAYIWSSSWCAMEWDVFASREVRQRIDGQPTRQTAILPVRWVPVYQPVPERIAAIHRFTPPEIPSGMVALYTQHGVFGLIRMRLHDEVSVICWTLAQQIVSIHNDFQVIPNDAPDVTTLRRSFEEDS
jgi:hypothetical protein